MILPAREYVASTSLVAKELAEINALSSLFPYTKHIAPRREIKTHVLLSSTSRERKAIRKITEIDISITKTTQTEVKVET